MTSASFTMRIDPDTRHRLERAAREEDRSTASVAQRAITEFLDRRDAFHLAIDQSLAEAERGELVDGEAVHAWIKTWGTEKPLPQPTSATHPFKA